MTRPNHLRVVADPTPGPHRTDSDEVLWWLPILVPTATWLAYLLARHAACQPDICWDTATLARTLGLAGSESKLWASLERLDRFGVARFVATDTLTLRLWLPPLSPRHIDRLPEPLATVYRHHEHS
jgi:hypothetical protein